MGLYPWEIKSYFIRITEAPLSLPNHHYQFTTTTKREREEISFWWWLTDNGDVAVTVELWWSWYKREGKAFGGGGIMA
jgi:hypothetical protein